MKLKILTHKKNKDKFKEFVKVAEVETVHDDGQLEMVMKLVVSIELTNNNTFFQIFLTDPGYYRQIDQLVNSIPKSQLHVLLLQEIPDDEEDF